MRPLLTLLIALSGAAAVSGCAAIGYERIPAPPRAAAEPPAPPPAPVLVVVVDGLRRDVLSAYVDELANADHVPGWPSGLALLALDDFALHRADRAEAPTPAVGLAPSASLATGAFSGAHGLPASRLNVPGPAGRLRRFDFLGARDASRIYFNTGFAIPTPGAPPHLTQLTRLPTVYRRLAGHSHPAVVFDRFGDGAEWLIPSTGGAGINAILPHRIGAAAVPLFDRGVRAAAIDLIRRRTPPDLISLYFREVLVESCLDTARRCEAPDESLEARQRQALRTIDGHLWRILRTWRAAHPEGFEALTLILLSTGGVEARPDDGAVDDGDGLWARLQTGATAPCAEALKGAHQAGDLRLETEGAAAFLTLRPLPLGQRRSDRVVRDCLAQQLAAAVRSTPPALAAYALRGNDDTVSTALSPRAAAGLPAYRRPRVQAQLAHSLHGAARRLDAVLILPAGAVFRDGARVPHGIRGNLSGAAGEAALLVASRRFEPTAARTLRSAPIELTDLAPTLAALRGAPLTAYPRPPFLSLEADTLQVPRADRVLAMPSTADAATEAREIEGALQAVYEEPASLWPPDEFVARFGEGRWTWDPDSGQFSDGAPCTYTEDATLRRWTCTFPVESDAPGRQAGGLWRLPAPEDDAGPDSSAGRAFERVGGDATPEFTAAVTCADDAQLVLSVEGQDPTGLDRLTVLLADAHGAGTPGDQPGASLVDVSLAADPASNSACTARSSTCAPPARPTQAPAQVAVPLGADLVAHHRRASRLFAAGRGDRAGLADRWRSAGGAEPAPTQGYLAARLCNAAGRCVQRPLVTLATWDTLREQGCP